MTAAAAIAKRAAHLIRDHGWIQGSEGSPDDGFCLTGACAYAVVTRKPLQDAWSLEPLSGLVKLYDLLLCEVDPRSDRCGDADEELLIRWNDDPDRTADDVLDVLAKIEAS